MVKTNIDDVIKETETLFKSFGNDNRAFTVDYDYDTDGLYCNYVPYPNDLGYAVSEDLLFVNDTSQKDLKKLKDWLEEKRIFSRTECEWDYFWGCKE